MAIIRRVGFNTHQNPDDRIMIRIRDIKGKILDNVKETSNEVVVHEYCPIAYQSPASACVHQLRPTQIFNLHALNPRHLV
jgi:hypothetical protein